MIACSACGKETSEGAFCAYCGESLATEEQGQPQHRSPSAGINRQRDYLLTALVVALLTIGALLFYPSGKPAKGEKKPAGAGPNSQAVSAQSGKLAKAPRPDYKSILATKVANDPVLAQYKPKVDKWVTRWRDEVPDTHSIPLDEDKYWADYNIKFVHAPPGTKPEWIPWSNNQKDDLLRWYKAVSRLQPYMRQDSFEMVDLSYVHNGASDYLKADFLAQPLSKEFGAMDAENRITLQFRKQRDIIILESINFWTDMEWNRRAKEIETITNQSLKQIQCALQLMYADCGFYPDSLDELTYSRASYGNRVPTGWHGPYLEKLPNNYLRGEPTFGVPTGWNYNPMTGEVKP